ncbi:MAG TPA: DUF4255 domain-containing protein [Pyrinomonadaceae bacterium]|jgi:hypothetical protein
MALVDTGKAIGAVANLLIARLSSVAPVTVGRHEQVPKDGPRINLFLYESQFDPTLRNHPLDEGQPPPLWLVLRFLIAAFDEHGESDTPEALEVLGQGLSALQRNSFLSFNGEPANIIAPLADNPEDLKITFDEANSDLLSKLVSGADEKYRYSVGFQVRPVMIAAGEPSSYSLLVGVDYTKTPVVEIGEKGIQIPVIPSLGPTISEIEPSKFEVGSIVAIKGTDLNLSGLSVSLGPIDLPVVSQRPDKLTFEVDGAIATGDAISAGSHAIAVVQTLPTGRRRPSNVLVAGLIPTITTAAIAGGSLTINPPPPPPKPQTAFATIDLTGILLGKKDDDCFLALYRDGTTVRLFDTFTDEALVPPPPPMPAQSAKSLKMVIDDSVPVGDYLVIYRVNGQQAKQSPVVSLGP